MIEQLEARFEANLAVARMALGAANAEPWVKGSRGQPAPHPGFAVATKADEVALRLAAELRLLRRDLPDDSSPFDELDDLVQRRRARAGEATAERG